ncbi:TPA: cellulase family glycosylhydrolase [Klebsiella aerogenes]|nr:cellulase family glycosylhydrolase [Klebsiella aerogenes]
MKKTVMLNLTMTALLFFSTILYAEEINSFVTQKGNQLQLDGESFRFMGTNNYYMHYKSNEAIDDVLDNASDMGLKAIRIWGFLDGIDSSGYSIQPRQGEFPPFSDQKNALERLDYTISQAKKKGIRIVLVLTNNWKDFGGMGQYVKWAGKTQHDDFYRDENIKNAYKNYVKFLLTHKNQYTGIPYNEEPTIMTLQLTNEARASSDPSGDLLVNWTKEMSDYVRTIAPNHLISLGSEGFFNRKGENDWTYNGSEGVDWERIIQLPNINYEVIHMYTDQWGKKNAEQWGSKWIKDHLDAGKLANKPVVLEEYGISNKLSLNREMIYEKWNQVAYENGASGSMFWILTGKDPDSPDGVYPDYDGYRVMNDSSPVSELLKLYAKKFSGVYVVIPDKVHFTYPIDGGEISASSFIATVYPLLYSSKPMKVDLDVDGKNYTMQKQPDGYYYANINSADIGYDKHVFKVNVVDDKNKTVSKTIVANIRKPIQGYTPIFTYHFDNDTQGWHANGSYQSEWGDKGLTSSDALGKDMLKIDAQLPGLTDWEELRIKNDNVNNIKDADLISFDILIPTEGVFSGEFRPYITVSDSDMKLGLDENKKEVKELDRVTMNGAAYIKHSVSIPIKNVIAEKPSLTIGVVGNKLQYNGPIYIANIKLQKALR